MKPKFIYNPGDRQMEPMGTYGKKVKVIWRGRTVFTMNSTAEYFDWNHKGMNSDIIAYRIIGEGK